MSLPNADELPTDANDITFELQGLSIKGGETFDVTTITSLMPPETGSNISLSDLYAYADRITQYYREAGFALSFALVPAQEIIDGKVRIEIIEGRIDELIIRDENLSDRTRRHILDAFARFADKGLTKTHDLEAFLISINNYPGITARGVVKPGAMQGSSSLVLEVTQQTQTATTGYQNYLSDSLGRDVFLADIALLGNGQAETKPKYLYAGRQTQRPIVLRPLITTLISMIVILKVFFRASESRTQPEKGALADLNFSSRSYSQEVGLDLPVWQRRASSMHVGTILRINNQKLKMVTRPPLLIKCAT